MRIPWRVGEFERTCLDCGYSWRVPAAVARRRARPISGFTGAPRGLRTPDDSVPEITSPEAIGEVAAAYAHCPRCSCDRYTQRPVKR